MAVRSAEAENPPQTIWTPQNLNQMWLISTGYAVEAQDSIASDPEPEPERSTLEERIKECQGNTNSSVR